MYMRRHSYACLRGPRLTDHHEMHFDRTLWQNHLAKPVEMCQPIGHCCILLTLLGPGVCILTNGFVLIDALVSGV